MTDGGRDRIELRAIRALGVHGVLEHEQQRPQPFEVDLDIEADLNAAGSSDRLGETIDYGALVEDVAAVIGGPSHQLLESLAESIASRLLARPGVAAVGVSVRKLRPPVAVDLTSAGVRIWRRQSATADGAAQERADLLQALRQHRFFLRHTVRDLSDDDARRRTTASELTLAGIIKHVAHTERRWARFIVEGAPALGRGDDEEAIADHEASFRVDEGESLASVLERYVEVAAETDALVARLPSFDSSHELPPAPWFEPGARWTARRVLEHVIAETAQHAGHADIIRESLDGAKTMG